jgi:hypothetical protein
MTTRTVERLFQFINRPNLTREVDWQTQKFRIKTWKSLRNSRNSQRFTWNSEVIKMSFGIFFIGIPKHRHLFMQESQDFGAPQVIKSNSQICNTVYFHLECRRHSLNNEQFAAHCHHKGDKK